MCIHPPQKIVIKCTVYSCLSQVFLELQGPAVFSVGSNFQFTNMEKQPCLTPLNLVFICLGNCLLVRRQQDPEDKCQMLETLKTSGFYFQHIFPVGCEPLSSLCRNPLNICFYFPPHIFTNSVERPFYLIDGNCGQKGQQA